MTGGDTVADNDYKSEYSTLATIFNTGWSTESPVHYENLPFTPVVGTAWARFTVLGGGADFASIGSPKNNMIRHSGVIQIQCFVPLGSGVAKSREMADKALAIFMNSEQADYHFQAGYAVTVPAGDTDAWYQVNAVIPYWRDSYEYQIPIPPVDEDEPTEPEE